MKRTITTGLLLIFTSALFAQNGQTELTGDAYRIDQNAHTLGFRLPESASVNDLIFFTRDNGRVVKRIDITREILNEGRYLFAYDTIPLGTYTVSVAGNSRIKYSFRLTNTGKVTAVTLKDSKLMTTAISENQALTFNPRTREFIVASTIPFREGSKIEVFDEENNLMVSEDVTAGMMKAQIYPVKVGHLKGGTYAVSVDGVRFGTVYFAE